MKEQRQLSNIEIASFCRQTAMIVRAGITLTEGMDILINDTLDPKGKEILRLIEDECNKGNSLHEAIEATGVFPEYVAKLIALGEESGETDTVLNSLADYYDREEDISEGIRSAFTYPMIMIGMMILIIIILISKVLPIFNQVFVQLGTQMTPFAEKLMNIGSILSKYAAAIIIVLAVIVLVCVLLNQIPRFKGKFRKILDVFPLTREFYMNVAIGRFASGLSLAYSNGMETFHSLEMVEGLVENDYIREKVAKIREEIMNNATLEQAIAEADMFSNLYNRMISVASMSGNVDTVMKQIAEHYEVATQKQLNKILSIIEPTLVIILSVVVGIILLSVLLPLMGIMSSIG